MTARHLYRIYRHLRKQSGATALEGFFGIMLIVVCTIVVVGVAIVVHNQSVLNGAAQLAAQQALMNYDRQSYRGDDSDGSYFRSAANVAYSIAQENSRNLLAGLDSGSGVASPASLQSFTLECGPDFDAMSDEGCNANDPNDARAEKVTVTITARTSFLFFDLFSFLPKMPSSISQTATASAVSRGPEGR